MKRKTVHILSKKKSIDFLYDAALYSCLAILNVLSYLSCLNLPCKFTIYLLKIILKSNPIICSKELFFAS
jgi:hypothetical protein